VIAIYQAGIEEGNATFETSAPKWEAFTAARLPAHRYVAVSDGTVLGWVAASAVSDRCVYAGSSSTRSTSTRCPRPRYRPAAAGRPHRLDRGRGNLDDPVRHLPGEHRQRGAAPGGWLPRRGDQGADRPALRALTRRRLH
jgi:hypothetical protein